MFVCVAAGRDTVEVNAMRRKLLLVGLDWVRRKDPPVSLATASIAAACASVADNVRTLTLNVNNAKPFVEMS